MILEGVLAALALVAISSPGELGGSPPRQPLDSVFACYQRARSETLLGRSQVDDLCEGASDASPVDCYVVARARTFLSIDDAMSLCRCATSPEPVDCYRRGVADTTLDRGRLRDLCSPSVRMRLGPDCAPEP
jgi:hypothetical protein